MTRILRGLTSERLPCGCGRGIYETYDGRVVAVFDERGESCQVRGHDTGTVVVVAERQPAAPVQQPAA